MREIHRPEQEVPRLVEDLLAVLRVGHVALTRPRFEERVEPRRVGAIHGVHRPLVWHERVGGSVEEQGRRVAFVHRAEQVRARQRHRRAHTCAGVFHGRVPDVHRRDRAGRRTADRDTRRIDAVRRRVGSQPPDRGLRVFAGLGDRRQARGGRCARRTTAGLQSVVDRDVQEALLREDVGFVDDLTRGLVAAAERTAVHPHDRRSLRHRVAGRRVHVELQRHGLVLSVDRSAVGDVGGFRHAREHVLAVTHRRRRGGGRHVREVATRREEHEHDDNDDENQTAHGERLATNSRHL